MHRNAVGFCVVVCLMLVGCGSRETGGVKVAEKAQGQEKAVASPKGEFTNSIGMELR